MRATAGKVEILVLAAIIAVGMGLPSLASAGHSIQEDRKQGGFFDRHPLLRKAAKGAALGIVTGGAAGVLLGRDIGGAAALGAGRGAATSAYKHKVKEDRAAGRKAGPVTYTKKLAGGTASVGKKVGEGSVEVGKDVGEGAVSVGKKLGEGTVSAGKGIASGVKRLFD